MPIHLTSANAHQFAVYSTYYVRIAGEPIAGDVFITGDYQVQIAAGQIIQDAAGAAVETVRSRLHITSPEALSFHVYDQHGTEITAFCDGGEPGVYAQMTKLSDSPLAPIRTLSNDEYIEQIFAAMR